MKMRGRGPLRERRLATGVRRLLDGVDQAVQVGGGLEGRLVAFAVADRLSEQRVHLTDVYGFT
jgi:hypothetical protein